MVEYLNIQYGYIYMYLTKGKDDHLQIPCAIRKKISASVHLQVPLHEHFSSSHYKFASTYAEIYFPILAPRIINYSQFLQSQKYITNS